MRLTVLALTLLPVAAHAQSTTLPAPTEPLTQSQRCPVGMAWDAGLNACAQVADKSSPLDHLGMGVGCEHGAAREVTS